MRAAYIHPFDLYELVKEHGTTIDVYTGVYDVVDTQCILADAVVSNEAPLQKPAHEYPSWMQKVLVDIGEDVQSTSSSC